MRFKNFLLFFLLFTFFLSQKYQEYIVKEGDSYYLIGKRFLINYLDLIKINKGKRLIAGEVIQIPFYFYHIVKNDENLSFLAKKYLVSNDDIRRLNDLKNDYLYVGQEIKIPRFISKIKIPEYIEEDGSYNPNQTNNYHTELLTTQELFFTWPVNGKILNQKVSSFNDNMNLGIPIKTLANDTVYASEDGVVLFQGTIRGFGKITLINHSGDLITAYMGVKEFYVYEKQVVQKGQPIAKTNKSLFFSIFLKGDPQNPVEFFKDNAI